MLWGQCIVIEIGVFFKIIGDIVYFVGFNEGILIFGKILILIEGMVGINLILCLILLIMSWLKFKDVEFIYFDVKKGEWVKVKVFIGIDDVDVVFWSVIIFVNEV